MIDDNLSNHSKDLSDISTSKTIPLILLNLLFFCSGTAALIYEVSWNRQLGLMFGHTTHASATVLASYFAGMAIGYGLGGRWSNRISPLKGYAICEWIVAIWACLIPSLLLFVESTFLSTLLQHPQPAVQIACRVLFCVVLLLPATAALGATLPMMAAVLVTTSEETRTKLTLAYACNTLGALVGALLSASVMLVSIGVSRSAYVAAILSALCGAVAWAISRKTVTSPDQLKVNSVAEVHEAVPPAAFLWPVTAALSGFVVLALEVLYARLFSLVFHNSTYTFGFVLFVFLLGLSLGSMLIRWLAPRFRAHSLLCGISWSGSVSVLLSLSLFVFITQLQYFDFGNGFVEYFWGSFGLVLLTCLVPAVLLGMLLPLVWMETTRNDQHRARRVGQLTLTNTLAAAAGAISASFLLIPQCGLWGAFVCLSVLLLIPILLSHQITIGSVLMSCVALTIMAPFIMSDPERWVVQQQSDVLLKRWNSSYGWIDIVEDRRSGAKKVRQNLHYRFGSTGANSAREFRQAHLPLLLHPAPSNALFLGLGTGMTAAGAIPHTELKQIVVVELIPEVVDAVRWLKAENRNVVDDTKVTMVIDDARHHLQTTQEHFDVIVSDLFVPWESETGYLYTVEHYRQCRSRLKPQGIFCQWLPLYQLGPQDYEMIADSLRHVFPHVSFWWGNMSSSRPMIALIASEAPLSIRPDSTQQRIQQMTNAGLYEDSMVQNSQQLFELYAGDWPLHQDATLNTDEHPWVEFHAPISHQSRRLLQKSLLKAYYDQVLINLKTENVKLDSTIETNNPDHRQWHRTVLFPE